MDGKYMQQCRQEHGDFLNDSTIPRVWLVLSSSQGGCCILPTFQTESKKVLSVPFHTMANAFPEHCSTDFCSYFIDLNRIT